MRYFLLIFALLCLGSASALAACYSQSESEAEQALRLHSELMVIGLTCQYGPSGTSLMQAYGQFTQRNLSYIQTAEKNMQAFYRKIGKPPVDSLDQLRTKLGNDVAARVVETGSPQIFCSNNADWAENTVRLSGSAFKQLVQQAMAQRKSFYQLCK